MKRSWTIPRNHDRDNAILGLRADGLAAKAIAKSLDLPVSTVTGVIDRARAKRDVRTGARDLSAIRERVLVGWAAGESAASIGDATALDPGAVRSAIARARRAGDERASFRRADKRTAR